MDAGNGPEGWPDVLDDLESRRLASRAMGGEERLAEAPLRREARRPCPDRSSPRPRLVRGDRDPRRGRRRAGGRRHHRLGHHRRAAGDGGGRGLHRAGRAPSAVRPTPSAIGWRRLPVTDRVPLVMMLEGAGFRADGKSPHAIPDRPARPSALLRAGAPGHGRARRLRRPWRAGGADVRLRGDERACVDLHGRASGRPRIARRDDHQGGPGRPGSRDPQRPDPQRRPPTTGAPSTLSAPTSRYFPSSAWSYPPEIL